MSGAFEEREQLVVDSMQIEARAADWLERRDREDWKAQDQQGLDLWLAQSPAHEIAFWRLEAAWGRTERLVVLRPSAADVAARAQQSVIPPVFLRIAAALAIVAALGIAASNFLPHPQDRTFATPVGGRETVSFADGSKVELNTNTVLRTRMTTDQRIVWLDKGEAYFEVRHDTAHPFVVIAGNRRVTDLGTEFSVRRDFDQLKVAVLEGRVRFAPVNTDAQARVLTQGTVAAASANAMVVTKRSIQALTNELSWRQGVLVFDETALGEAAAEFNRYNSRRLVIADPEIARLVIDGTLPTDDIEGFARLAQTVLGLHVEQQRDEIVISR